ncbi:MAG: heme ABC exporter ATP-binding protein CcmA [Anaerolineales bacterium]
MIEIRDLTKTFGPQRALAGIDLHIEPGEWVTLAGPNGAGKTTLLRILATLSRPTSGHVRLWGLDPQRRGDAIRRQIGFFSHRTLLYDDLTAEQNLAFYARVYGLPNGPERSAELLDRLQLTARRYDRVATYSRGMQQRLAMARALLHRPQLLLLDEPYAGLDPLAAEALSQWLTKLNAAGCTLLLTTHTLESSACLGQRAVILRRGRIIHDAPLTDRSSFPALYRRLVSEGQDAATPPDRPAPSRPTASTALPQAEPAVPFWRQVGAIVVKDLAAELHTREILNAMFVFAVLILLIFSFALDLRGTAARAAAPGVLWCAITFAGTLGLSRSLAREQQTGGLEGLLVAPLDRTAILFGKALGNLLLMLAMEVILLPLGTILLNVPLLRGALLPILFAGTLGYAVVGTLLAAIAVNTRAREVLLPILLLPLITPLLIAAVQATGRLLDGLSWTEIGAWRRLLVVYDLVIVAVAMLTFEYVVEE